MGEIKIVSRYDANKVLFAGEFESVRDCVQAAVKAGANLAGAYLAGAYLDGADLDGANLDGANLAGANLTGADLDGAYLAGANLAGAYLAGADLDGADLDGANLAGANLAGADLAGADLAGANLAGATMPDGRLWEMFSLDPLAGICDVGEARERAISAWGSHEWGSCPMSAANGYKSFGDAPADKRIAVAAFVATFDARLLSAPAVAP